MKNFRVKWQIFKEILSADDAIVITYKEHPILGDKVGDKRTRFRASHFGGSRMVVELFWHFMDKVLDDWLDYWDNKDKPGEHKKARKRKKKNEAD